MAFPVLKSKLVRNLSIIPKLYLRPSADLSGRLTWSGQANLLTAQHSTLLVQAALRPTRWKLDVAPKASRSACITITFPVRSTPAYAAYDQWRLFLSRWSIDQREWLDELRLREFHEGGWVIEQLQMVQEARRTRQLN